jgi:hypothetical protein
MTYLQLINFGLITLLIGLFGFLAGLTFHLKIKNCIYFIIFQSFWAAVFWVGLASILIGYICRLVSNP